MTRTTFENSEAAHIWASQSQSHGKGSKGSIFFQGAAIYSYGSHYLAGFIIGRDAFLNARQYSVSTSQHMSHIRQASRHYAQFYLPEMTELYDVLMPIARDGKLARDAWQRGAFLKWVRENARKLTRDRWQQSDLEPMINGALRVAELAGVPAASVLKAQREGLADAAKEKAERIAAELKSDLREAIALVGTDAEFWERWRSHYGVSVASPHRQVDLDNLDRLQESARNAAKRLFRLRRTLKAHKGSKRRLDALKARETTIREHLAELPAIARQTHREQIAAHVVRFRAEYEGAADLTARYHIATRNSVTFWLGAYDEGTAERTFLEGVRAFIDERREAENVIAAKAAYDRLQEQRKTDAFAFAAWVRGDAGSRCPASFRADENGRAFLRRSPDGAELQTSQGASVPWDHALRAFRFVKLCRERGEGFRSNGRTIRVGHYTVDSIDPFGNMTAGCHHFSFEEMTALATRENVSDAAPSDAAVTDSHK